MEKEINIAEILRGKPKGTKLYSPIFGECEFEHIQTNSIVISTKYYVKYFFTNDGRYIPLGTYFKQGECLLFPSKELRDWSKFAWKKGDVVVSNDGKYKAVFDKFTDDSYTKFYGQYILMSNENGGVDYVGNLDGKTEEFSIEDKDTAQCYINTIEEKLGGKLNMETLDIEPAKPKWTPKPFDKVLVRSNDSNSCWKPMLFSMMLKNGYAGIDGFIYPYCIPYNEETAKLIGTTNDYKED